MISPTFLFLSPHVYFHSFPSVMLLSLVSRPTLATSFALLSTSSAIWEGLGDMPAGEAMRNFVTLLQAKVPAFQPWLDERLKEKADQERKERELQERLERERLERIERERLEKERLERERIEKERQEQQRIQAEKERQERERIEKERQRIEQLRLDQEARQKAEQEKAISSESVVLSRNQSSHQLVQAEASSPSSALQPSAQSAPAQVDSGLGQVAPYDLPYITIPDFLDSIKEKPDCTFAISRGELVTIRVPNPEPSGVRIFWQFYTPDYDIAFGLEYERTDSKTPQVDPVLPIIRCASNEKVQVGTHAVTAPGNWLFNFDNVYSYLRSKTLHLRVVCKPLEKFVNPDV